MTPPNDQQCPECGTVTGCDRSFMPGNCPMGRKQHASWCRAYITNEREPCECNGTGRKPVEKEWARRDGESDYEAMSKPVVRPCTCHPDDAPPQPCAEQYAFGECKPVASGAVERAHAYLAAVKDRDSTARAFFGEALTIPPGAPPELIEGLLNELAADNTRLREALQTCMVLTRSLQPDADKINAIRDVLTEALSPSPAPEVPRG